MGALVANRMICNINAHGNQTGPMVTLWGGKLGKKEGHADIGTQSNVVINVYTPSCKALFFCLGWQLLSLLLLPLNLHSTFSR
jgi:hypothetical protein